VRIARRGLPLLILAATVTAALAADTPPGLQTSEMGAGGATIVLLHGMGGTRLDWLPTVKRLKDRFHVVMVELPGHGTNPLPEPFSLEAASDEVDAVIARQKPESTIVVGQGLGGLLALGAISRHPGHARGLVLIDAGLKSPIPIDDQQIQGIVRFMDDNYGTFTQMAFSKMGRDSAESAIMLAKMAAVPPVTVKAFFRNLLLADGNRDLKAVPFPVELVFTERTWKSGELWSTVAKKFGYEDTTIAVPRRIAGAGILVMKDQPDTLASIVSRYAGQRFAAKK
jgi:pimeloyl-ACP methyl ester carboxylesterase